MYGSGEEECAIDPGTCDANSVGPLLCLKRPEDHTELGQFLAIVECTFIPEILIDRLLLVF